MFEKFDGTNRVPRKVQSDALKELSDNWNSFDVFGLSLPTGAGKSAIGRTIQLETKAAYLASENVLVKQILETYPTLNSLIGRKHYTCCENPELSCEDKHLLSNEIVCSNCKYIEARTRAINGEDTIYNPISYYYASMIPGWKPPNVIIMDEAHKLNDILSMLSGEEFGKSYNPPKDMSLYDIVDWLKEQERLMMRIVLLSESNKAVKHNITLQKIRRVKDTILENPEQFFHMYKEDGTLIIMPISPPKKLRDRLLRCNKLVVMSASLFKSDMQFITDKKWSYIEGKSPIPIENRRIFIKNGPIQFNFETPAIIIAEWIKSVLKTWPGRNTIIHVSYSLADKLKEFFKDCHFNSKENKQSTLDKFKRKGGVWFASGCSEGLDLYDDLCTLNIIPLLPNANVADPVVRKKLALPGGVEDYEKKVLRTVQQMAGRSTRNETDRSIIVTADSRLKKLVNKYKEDLPESFIEQILERT